MMVGRTMYQLGVVTLIAAIMWVGLGVYMASGKTTVIDVDKSTLEPINPNLDQTVLESLAGREKIEIDLTAIAVSSESATINIVEVGTGSARIEGEGVR